MGYFGNHNRAKYKPSCEQNKVCPQCRQEFPKDTFGYLKTSKGTIIPKSYCPSCRRKSTKNSTILSKFGLALDDYKRLVELQHGLCACCGQPETALNNRNGELRGLSIDHDHQTGKVRQLLCHRCNIVIGLVKEDPDLCELIRQYVLTHKEEG